MSPNPLRHLRRPGGPGRSGDPSGTAESDSLDGGFILLESLLSITLLAIIMAALTTFVVTVTNSTTYQRQRQAAVQLGNSTLEQVRGLTAGDLPLGRTASQDDAQFTTASAVVKPWLASMTRTADPAATATSTPTLAVATTSTLNGTLFTSTTYLGTCSIPTDTTLTTDCTPAPAATAGYLRTVVAVTWPGTRCAAGTCTYVTSTLVSTDNDPTFTLNQAAPAAPAVTDPGAQTSLVGDTSTTPGVTNLPLQLQLDSGTGVAPVTWQVVGLPAGLSSSTTGLISGSPTTAGAAVTVTVTAFDAFQRPATKTFTWTVYPPVVGNAPSNQNSTVNATTPVLALTATGGSGAPYTWTDPTTSLPPGLGIGTDGRSVTGTPTKVGTYQVALTVSDAGGRSPTVPVTFTWTVVYPPLTASAADRTATVTSTVSTQFTATGGSGGPYTWTDPTGTLPTGLTVSTSGLVTGKPTVVGAKAVTLRVTDTTSGLSTDVPFTWTIVAPPSVNGLVDPVKTARGSTVTAQPLTYTCPTASCSLTLTGAPGGIGIAPDTTSAPGAVVTATATSGTVYLRGTVSATAALGAYAVQVTPLDTTGNVVGTADTATWTVAQPPTVTGLTTPFRVSAGATVTNQTLPYTCASGACTLTLTGAPGGIGLSTATTGTLGTAVQVSAGSGSVYLRGVVSATAAPGTTTVSVTPTDTATGAAGTQNQATWTVVNPPTVTGLTAVRATAGAVLGNQTLPYTCASGACTLTLTGAPTGIGLSTATTGALNTAVQVSAGSGSVYLRGTVAGSTAPGNPTVTVTPTDSATGSAGTPNQATWTVLAPPTVAGLPSTYSTAQGSTIPVTQLPFTCPSASCTIALTGAPPGLGIALDSTSAIGSTVTVTVTSGYVYVRGTVSAYAATTTYPVAVVPTDTPSGVVGSGTSTALTVTSRCTTAQQTAYRNAVTADAPSTWFRFGETSGTAALDSGSARRNGIYTGGPTLGVDGALFCDPSTAISLNGTSSQVTSSAPAAVAPNTFSVEAWFSTTVGGGKIIGYGNSQTGTSGSYDRHVYLTDTGQVAFGVFNNGVVYSIISPGTYLDGQYHHVVATMSGAGMVLYVDGARVGSNANTVGEATTGWWRIGYDNLNGWPGITSRYYFTGSLDEVAVYPYALSAARVAAHYNADR